MTDAVERTTSVAEPDCPGHKDVANLSADQIYDYEDVEDPGGTPWSTPLIRAKRYPDGQEVFVNFTLQAAEGLIVAAKNYYDIIAKG